MASHTGVKPARFRFYSPELGTNVRRTYGYEAFCACGWTGKVWKSHHEARLEQSFHVCEAAAPTADLGTCGSEYRSLGLRCVLPVGHAGPHSETPQATGRAEAS